MSSPAVTTDVATPTLYVCHLDGTMPSLHPCGKARKALDEAGVSYERVVYGKGRPFGIGTTGTRPDLEAASGQEKLPVLVVPGGEVVAGSKAVVAWARAHAS